MSTDINIQPRVRAYGNSRIEITKRAQDEREWQNLWREPLNPFPFKLGGMWKHCVEYRVGDFASEVGFFIDILGMPVSAFSPNYAQFTSPDQEFVFAVTAATDDEPSTPPEAIRLQFQVHYLLDTILELEGRGIHFEKHPPDAPQSSVLAVACFRTPNGIPIDLVGEIFVDEDLDKADGFESQDLIGDDLEDELEDLNLENDDDLEDQIYQLEEEDEALEVEPAESRLDDPDDADAPGLPSWTNLLTRQDAQRSRHRQSQTYPRPSKTPKYRIPPNEATPSRKPRQTSSNGELTYSALDEDEPEFED